jgi:hypothetical protein
VRPARPSARRQAPPGGRAPDGAPRERRPRGLPRAASTRTARSSGARRSPSLRRRRPRGRSISATSIRGTSRPRAGACRATTPSRPHRRPDRHRSRSDCRLARLRAPRAHGRRQPELRRAGVDRSAEVVVADDGYWHQVQMERLASDGRDAGAAAIRFAARAGSPRAASKRKSAAPRPRDGLSSASSERPPGDRDYVMTF